MKRFFAAFLALLFLCPGEVFAAERPDPPVIAAEAGILIDASTGQVLAEKNSRRRMEPASLTKIMTCLLGMEANTPDARITVTAEALELMPGASIIGLTEGEILTMGQLLRAAMLPSANDAAAAVGIHLAGSSEKFAEMMNQKVTELGLTDTHFANAHGLPAEDHYSTAYDLAQITRAALEYQEFIAYAGTRSYEIPATRWNRGYSFSHLNRALRSDSGYYDPRAIAGKTGWTTSAGNCLMTVAQQNGVRLIAVVLKETGAGSIYQDTKALFDYGFSAYRREEFLLPSSQVTALLPASEAGREKARLLSAESRRVAVLVPVELSKDSVTLALSGLEVEGGQGGHFWGKLVLRDQAGETLMDAGRIPLQDGTLSAEPLGPSRIAYLFKKNESPPWPVTAAVAAGCGAVFILAKLLYGWGRTEWAEEEEETEEEEEEADEERQQPAPA